MIPSGRTGVTTYATPSDTEFTISRVFDAPQRLVWEAYTDPKHVTAWMLGPEGWTMPVCEMDLRPGGAWRYVWRRENGTEMEMHGNFRVVEPYSRLVHTERWGGDWAETVNTLELREESGRTTVTQTMLFPSREARDRATASGMTSGVERSFELLEALLRSAGRVAAGER